MIKKLLKIIFVFILSSPMFSQQANDAEANENSNPIIYVEGFGGPTVVKNIGISGGVELNCQSGKSLFSFRYINAVGYRQREENYIIAPRFYKSEDTKEYALLYGGRWLSDNHSYSISAGISRVNMEWAVRDLDDVRHGYYENFYAVPFEANYKWFYSKKKSNLIFNAMIPSVGVKLFGSIGEYSFVGVGVTVGFGFSKHY
ncbi:hypothetical protein GKZ90_0010500 [Flavobacterium sp. MC2016-06]|uniref:hypothetical protein n=1 Tax=Flavobacterium sp. MC2016-06 TaxID=2676308 RepID=UPI0012BB19B3|nr:hypothetical protein [Flavobacterium sp. MC2016-06]MBU3858529.1 hypothetical protein [Flavobacterium sp. MC2016-06]